MSRSEICIYTAEGRSSFNPHTRFSTGIPVFWYWLTHEFFHPKARVLVEKKTEKQRLKDEQYAWNTETKFMSQCQQRGLFQVVGRLCAIFGHVKPRPACRMAPPRLPKRTRPPSCSTPTAETSIPGLHCFVHKANPDVRHMWGSLKKGDMDVMTNTLWTEIYMFFIGWLVFLKWGDHHNHRFQCKNGLILDDLGVPPWLRKPPNHKWDMASPCEKKHSMGSLSGSQADWRMSCPRWARVDNTDERSIA